VSESGITLVTPDMLGQQINRLRWSPRSGRSITDTCSIDRSSQRRPIDIDAGRPSSALAYANAPMEITTSSSLAAPACCCT
jgi:hypothetical protein